MHPALRLVVVFLAALSGCANTEHEAIDAHTFWIDAYLYSPEKMGRALTREAAKACPAGFEILEEVHTRVVEGPRWRWRIRCN